MLLDEREGIAVGLQRLREEGELLVEVFFGTDLAAAVKKVFFILRI